MPIGFNIFKFIIIFCGLPAVAADSDKIVCKSNDTQACLTQAENEDKKGNHTDAEVLYGILCDRSTFSKEVEGCLTLGLRAKQKGDYVKAEVFLKNLVK